MAEDCLLRWLVCGGTCVCVFVCGSLVMELVVVLLFRVGRGWCRRNRDGYVNVGVCVLWGWGNAADGDRNSEGCTEKRAIYGVATRTKQVRVCSS